MAVLIDTSIMLAVLVPKDQHYAEARVARQNLKDKPIIPAPVLYELFYMISSRINHREAVKAYDLVRSAFPIEGLTDADMARMSEIMRQYSDAELDFADAAIMAIAERLNITEVYTFDHRDFSLFRPKHIDHLTLRP